MQADPGQARSEVFTRYRTPVYGFIRNRGFSEADAEDLTQEVFLRVCREEFLRKADRDAGRFRTLLLAVTRNVIFEERRKKQRSPASSLDQDGIPEPAASPEEGEVFDRLWSQNLIRLALERLQQETSANGPKYYEAFILNKIQNLPYAEVGERLGVSVTDVTNWIHQARKKIRKYLEEEIRSYASSNQEYQAETTLIPRDGP